MPMPLSSCDEDRLRLAKETQKKFDQARALAAKRDYAAALECYLFAFDNSLAVEGWGGVRLSYIPAEIAELGENYPPALTALKLRRDAREELIRRGERDFNVLSEWNSLNSYLGDFERELALLKELEDKGVLDDSLKDKIITSNFERLLSERRYDVLSEYLDNLGYKFLHTIFHRETELLFPKRRPRFNESMSDFWKDRIREEGAKVFELALGAKKPLQADEIAKRILLHCCDAETYNRLIAAALRAGQKGKARTIAKQAKATLSSSENAEVNAVKS
jgi:hypothetical protein